MTALPPLFRLPLLALVLALLLPAAALAEDPEVITVQVEGLGADADGALKNAFQRAVQEAVGTLVDSETLVQNEELIMDEVLTYSDALVTGFEIIEEATKDMSLGGLFRIKIEARVERKAVAEKLESSGALSSSVSGKDLWAEHLSAVQGVQDGRKLLQKFFDTHPPNYLWVGRVLDDEGRSGKNTQFAQRTDYDAGVSYVAFNLELFVDMESYFTRYAPKLISLLDVISEEVVNDSLGRTASPEEGVLTALTKRQTYAVNSSYSSGGGWESHVRGALQEMKSDGAESDMFVAVLVGQDARATNQRSRVYRLNGDAYAGVFSTAAKKDVVRLRITLLDARGHVIKQFFQRNSSVKALTSSSEDKFEIENGPTLVGARSRGYEWANELGVKGQQAVFAHEMWSKGHFDEKKNRSVYEITPELRGKAWNGRKALSTPSFVLRHVVSLSVDELKELSSIQLEFLGPEEK